MQATVRFQNGSSGIITYVTGGNARYPKETLDAAAAAGARGSTTSARPRSGPGGGHEHASGPAAARTRASAPSSRSFVEACLTGAPMPIPLESLVATTRATIAVRRQPAERQAGAGVSAPPRHGSAGTRAGSPGCRPAEVAWRARDQALQAAWSRRQVTREQLARAVDGAAARRAPVHRRPAARHRRAGARGGQGGRAGRPRTGCCRVSGRCWASLRTDMVQPDWFRDPVTGRRSAPDRYAFRINHRSEEQTGNVKQVWEISRLQHLTLLATAWFLTHDERYARRVADQLRSWWRENPFLSGVHWTSGIEIGIRLISLAWIRRLLDDWPGVADLFEHDELAVRQIRWHQQYLAAFRSRGSSANNHVIAEAAGQLVASCAFPWFRGERALAAQVRAAAGARADPQHLPVRHRPRACLGLPVLRRRTRVPRRR